MAGFCLVLINSNLTKLQVTEIGFTVKSQRKHIHGYLNCDFICMKNYIKREKLQMLPSKRKPSAKTEPVPA